MALVDPLLFTRTSLESVAPMTMRPCASTNMLANVSSPGVCWPSARGAVDDEAAVVVRPEADVGIALRRELDDRQIGFRFIDLVYGVLRVAAKVRPGDARGDDRTVGQHGHAQELGLVGAGDGDARIAGPMEGEVDLSVGGKSRDRRLAKAVADDDDAAVGRIHGHRVELTVGGLVKAGRGDAVDTEGGVKRAVGIQAHNRAQHAGAGAAVPVVDLTCGVPAHQDFSAGRDREPGADAEAQRRRAGRRNAGSNVRSPSPPPKLLSGVPSGLNRATASVSVPPFCA